jgi:transposase-like protein
MAKLEIPDKSELKKLYYEEELSMRDIAEHFGVSINPVRRWFKELGIEERSPSENANLRIKKHGNPFKGKRHSQKTRDTISKKRMRLTDSECAALALDYVYFDDTFRHLRANYGVKDLNYYIGRAINNGVITREQYRSAMSRRYRKTSPTKKPGLAAKAAALALDYVYFDESFDELRKIYGVQDLDYLIDRAVREGVITREEYKRRVSGCFM